MAVDLLRQGHLHAHEHGRPDDGVEANYLLAHDMRVGRPIFIVVVVLIVQKAQSGAIVKQRVHPDIDHMTRVEVHGDAPAEAGAGNAQILKAGLYEVVYHLVYAGGRLKESPCLQQLLHGLCVLGQAEEVGFLLRVMYLSAAVRALAVLELALCPEALAGSAVLALVSALIDIALVVHLLEDALDGLYMIVVSCADKAVVGDVHQLPQVENAALSGDDLIHELLGRDPCGFGLLLDFLAMLVRAGEEHHIIAAQTFISGDGVRRDGAVGVPYVQLIRRIVDRRGDIKGFLLVSFHFLLSL